MKERLGFCNAQSRAREKTRGKTATATSTPCPAEARTATRTSSYRSTLMIRPRSPGTGLAEAAHLCRERVRRRGCFERDALLCVARFMKTRKTPDHPWPLGRFPRRPRAFACA